MENNDPKTTQSDGLEISQTHRGFAYYEFSDDNGNTCSLQKSSSALEDKIWLGANEIGLKEFKANRKPESWVDVQLENTTSHHYIANNRMHLTRDQVKQLLPILTKFVETGEI